SLTNPKIPAFGIRTYCLIKIAGKIGNHIRQKLGIDPYLTPYTKIRSKWVHDLGIKNEIINKLEEHRIVYSLRPVEGEGLYDQRELEIITDHKIENFDYTKLKSFCTNKTNADKIRREAINWENIFTVKGSDKGLISKIYRELTLIYKNQAILQLKNGQRI
uniref:Uncharacterized protein n=1 Tax=Sarcophilus harrisii TaxID=9305 RepID=A0A7N4V6C5_SARHA